MIKTFFNDVKNIDKKIININVVIIAILPYNIYVYVFFVIVLLNTRKVFRYMEKIIIICQ